MSPDKGWLKVWRLCEGDFADRCTGRGTSYGGGGVMVWATSVENCHFWKHFREISRYDSATVAIIHLHAIQDDHTHLHRAEIM